MDLPIFSAANTEEPAQVSTFDVLSILLLGTIPGAVFVNDRDLVSAGEVQHPGGTGGDHAL